MVSASIAEQTSMLDAVNSRIAASLFLRAREAGGLADMDSDEAADLARTASVNPHSALRALGHDTDGLVLDSESVYDFFMSEYYDNLFAREHDESEADVDAERQARTESHLNGLSRFCPDGQDGVSAAFAFGDESALRKYEEDMVFA